MIQYIQIRHHMKTKKSNIFIHLLNIHTNYKVYQIVSLQYDTLFVYFSIYKLLKQCYNYGINWVGQLLNLR